MSCYSGYKKAIPYNDIRCNNRPSHPSAPSSVLTCFPLCSPSIHSLFILSPLSFCVVAFCSSLSTFLSLAHPDTGTQTEGQACVCLWICTICLHVSMLECVHLCPWQCVCAAYLLYTCTSLCPGGYSLSSLGRHISVSGQPCDITL